MTRAKVVLGSVAGSLLIVAVAACADMASSFDGASGAPDGKGSDSAPNGSAAEQGAAGAPTATGVLLVHAAAFPSFRLCFENLPDQLPQPDTKVMPEANVVGVEIGSLVRINPLAVPGKVYVINESEVRSTANDPNAVKCGELVAVGDKKTGRSLTADLHYHVANEITAPLGDNRVSVIAISGCGSAPFLKDLGVAKETCGADWDSASGNLKAKVVELRTTATGATATTLPVQLFHMSPALEAYKGAGAIEVTFGELGADGGAAQPVSVGPIFSGGEQETLTVDQSKEAVYGTHGFRIRVSSPGAPFNVEQSLAAVQQLSAVREVPTTYYRAGSNYALLLLGDPQHTPTLDGGAPNPSYNPRQGVHLLAVPVLDPETVDAGTDAAPAHATDGGS